MAFAEEANCRALCAASADSGSVAGWIAASRKRRCGGVTGIPAFDHAHNVDRRPLLCGFDDDPFAAALVQQFAS